MQIQIRNYRHEILAKFVFIIILIYNYFIHNSRKDFPNGKKQK